MEKMTGISSETRHRSSLFLRGTDRWSVRFGIVEVFNNEKQH